MKLTLLATALAAVLATASPISPRAGGPIADPIPSNCTVINPLPHAACGTSNVNGYMPSHRNMKKHLLYQSYFTSPLSQDEEAKQCKQQCYGYGNTGECKASFVGYKVPTPKGWYGTEGGDLETACLLFKTHMNPNDFVEAPKGQYVNATAASIYCPKS